MASSWDQPDGHNAASTWHPLLNPANRPVRLDRGPRCSGYHQLQSWPQDWEGRGLQSELGVARGVGGCGSQQLQGEPGAASQFAPVEGRGEGRER